MKILITGAKGFVGRNLTANLENIRQGKNRTRPSLQIDEIYESAMEDDWVSYTKLEEALSKYWDKVPNELKEGGKS